MRSWKIVLGPFGAWLFADGYLSLFWRERRAQVFNALGEPLRSHVRWQRGFQLLPKRRTR